MFLLGDEDVVALMLYLDAQTTEGVGNDAQLVVACILDADTLATHRSHTDERTHLNHVGQDGMFGSMQFLHAFDDETVAGDA